MQQGRGKKGAKNRFSRPSGTIAGPNATRQALQRELIMNWQLLVPLLVTTIVAILGWYAAHAFTARRDRANKRRELRVTSLISAYRKLANCVQRNSQEELFKRADDLESAIAEIQLFGNPSQIVAAEEFVQNMVSTKSADIGELLNLLRADLRAELKLPAIDRGMSWIRVTAPR